MPDTISHFTEITEVPEWLVSQLFSYGANKYQLEKFTQECCELAVNYTIRSTALPDSHFCQYVILASQTHRFAIRL